MRNFRPAGVRGRPQRLAGRELLHAVVPVAEAEKAQIGHRRQQRLPGLARLEAVDRGDVVEQEGQIEDLELLGELVELGERGRDQLDVAERECLHLLGVAEQLGIRIDLDLDLAWQPLLRQLLEQQRALALGRALRHHVAELDHDLGASRRAAEAEPDHEAECGDGGEPRSHDPSP